MTVLGVKDPNPIHTAALLLAVAVTIADTVCFGACSIPTNRLRSFCVHAKTPLIRMALRILLKDKSPILDTR